MKKLILLLSLLAFPSVVCAQTPTTTAKNVTADKKFIEVYPEHEQKLMDIEKKNRQEINREIDSLKDMSKGQRKTMENFLEKVDKNTAKRTGAYKPKEIKDINNGIEIYINNEYEDSAYRPLVKPILLEVEDEDFAKNKAQTESTDKK